MFEMFRGGKILNFHWEELRASEPDGSDREVCFHKNSKLEK